MDKAAPFLVSTPWLADRLGRPGLAIVDASWYLPAQERDAAAEYRQGHIPGAVFFDIDAVSDASSPLPHMLPSAQAFAAAMGRLGIAEDMQIVVYDGAGLFSAPRVWWTFRTFGAAKVSILDGGLPLWRSEGRPIESGAPRITRTTFEAQLDRGAVADLAAVKAALDARDAQLLDARPGARFRGEVPEPRPGLRSGHMPGSLSLPVTAIAPEGRLADPQILTRVFTAAGVDLARPVITTCGSGVTAATLSFALAILGKVDVALYDGSWSEWGADPRLPVETGA